METVAKRKFSRCYYELPIMYSDCSSASFSKSKMYNSSMDGMYFESNFALQPGFDILIKKLNPAPDIEYTPEAYKLLKAKVIWCKKIEDMDISKYGIGVQFLKKHSYLKA